jgi:hypothetical protein
MGKSSSGAPILRAHGKGVIGFHYSYSEKDRISTGVGVWAIVRWLYALERGTHALIDDLLPKNRSPSI